MIEFSIIVPVYNTKKYIGQCLDSLLRQTYSNYEVILVDDGSTDGSELVCDDYVKKDDRFTVIHKTNAGVSSARNSGLERATGKWLMFVDSDDMLFDTSLEKLYSETHSDSCDAYFFSFEIFGSSQADKKFLYFPGLAEYRRLRPMDFIRISVKRYGWLPKAAWGGIILRSLVTENNIVFDIEYTAAEDAKFWYECMHKCSAVRYVLSTIYRYRVFRESSAMSTMNIRHILSRFRYGVTCYSEAANCNDSLLCNFFAKCAADAVADLYKITKNDDLQKALFEIEKSRKIILSAKGIKYRTASLVWLVFGFKRGSDILQLISKYILLGKFGR